MKEENQFIKGLKVNVDLKMDNAAPSDEEILRNMQDQDPMFQFDLKDIDRKIRVRQLTKTGQQLFLYRKKICKNSACGYDCIYSQYYIVNTEGKVVGRIPLDTNKPDAISMDYWIQTQFQGQGIGTVALNEVIEQIFDKKEFDGVAFSSIKYPEITETSINRINLEISEDNEASKRIASKNGFIKRAEGAYSLTLEDYMEQRNSDISK